jgi:hypothetical protein
MPAASSLCESATREEVEVRMPYLIDIYALAPERSQALVHRLHRFLPHRERAAADYWVKLGNIDPAAVFQTPEDMAQFCEAHPEAESRAYWNSCAAGDPRAAHVFFLDDGRLVLGLSVATEDESEWDRWLEQLMSFAGAEYGYWDGECPPKDTVAEFVAVSKRAWRTSG